MGFIAWVLFGLVVGIVAKFLMPGRDPGGFIITAVLGIVGAVLGGFIGQSLGAASAAVAGLLAVIGLERFQGNTCSDYPVEVTECVQ